MTERNLLEKYVLNCMYCILPSPKSHIYWPFPLISLEQFLRAIIILYDSDLPAEGFLGFHFPKWKCLQISSSAFCEFCETLQVCLGKSLMKAPFALCTLEGSYWLMLQRYILKSTNLQIWFDVKLAQYWTGRIQLFSFYSHTYDAQASLVAQIVKNLSACSVGDWG